MAPVAVGNGHTRVSQTNGDGGRNTASAGAKVNGKLDLNGTNRAFAHLDDLLTAKPDVDAKSPLRTILLRGELLAKQADTHLDFRRPDIALQEYISASVIAVEIVPRHPDYLALQNDRGDLHRLYTGLTKRISSQHQKFAEVKELIRENNTRTGVKPTTSIHLNGVDDVGGESHLPFETQINGHAEPGASHKKTAPAIQPKPNGLHGKAVPPQSGTGHVSDLAARFARLQNGGPVQDPRIKTRPIPISGTPVLTTTSGLPGTENRPSMVRPLGPRELPSVPKSQPLARKLPLDVTTAGMPRPPDAIHHSPLRAIESPETTNLPSSVSRTSSFLGHARTDSAPPISTVGPSPYVFDNRSGYFSSPTHSSHDKVQPTHSESKIPPLPNSNVITAEDLMGYLKQGQQSMKILIVDLRSREDFENGHIMSQFSICVEPITLRSGISGAELEDSMVIAPNYEQELFEERQEFDIVVFYDQSSTSIQSTSLGKDNNSILRDFAAAVYDYGYEKRLKRYPILLSGGIDAWIDLLGPNSLQTSSAYLSGTNSTSLRPKLATLSRQRPQSSSIPKRRVRPSRLKSKEDEKKWDLVLRGSADTESKTDDSSMSDELVYARTQDDFLRRYPEIPSVRESMVSSDGNPFQHFEHELNGVMPPTPARPAPALPRQRSSGITVKGPTLHYTHAAGPAITNMPFTPGVVGLVNPSQHCYLNTAIQLISATTQFKDFLRNFTPGSVPVPAKAGETSPPLQLMTRSLGNVISHMWSGQYKQLKPTTFKAYVNALHSAAIVGESRELAYGGSRRQHDAGEFLHWLLDVLEDELNSQRDKRPYVGSATYNAQLGAMVEAESASLAYGNLLKDKAGFIWESMGVMTQKDMSCNACSRTLRTYQYGTKLTARLPDDNKATYTLDQLLRHSDFGASDLIEEFNCEGCPSMGPATGTTKLARMPRILYIDTNRTRDGGGKASGVLKFGEVVDLTSIAITNRGSGLDPEFTPPFKYEVKSMMHHVGENCSKGHWIAYSKIRNRWYEISDSSVTQINFDYTQRGPGPSDRAGAQVCWLALERIPNRTTP